MKMTIDRMWDGAPAQADEVVRLHLRWEGAGMVVGVEAPLHGDPPPAGPAGPCWGLWDHEVVELFVLGARDRYTEVELGPHGHHLVLGLEGRRNIVARELPLEYDALHHGTHWSGRALIPQEYLPPPPWKGNAYAIHGLGAARRYLAWTPVPGPAPDFHRLAWFGPLSLP